MEKPDAENFIQTSLHPETWRVKMQVCITNKDPLWSTGNSAQYSHGLGGKRVCERVDICVYINLYTDTFFKRITDDPTCRASKGDTDGNIRLLDTVGGGEGGTI